MARASKRTARPGATTARTPAPPVEAERAESVEGSALAPTADIVEDIAVAAAPEPAESRGDEAAIVTAQAVVAALPAPDIAETFRAFVAKGVGETRARFEAARIASEQAFAAVEASYDAAQSGASAFHLRAIEAVQAGADAQFGLLKALAGARTVSDVVAVHTEYARRQYEEAASRAKELTELARKIAEESSAPLREHVAQAFKVAV